MLPIILVDLLVLFSAWLIGRREFSSLKDKPAQAANSQALLVALIFFALRSL